MAIEKKKHLNLQDVFLNSLRIKKKNITLMLLSGDSVTGTILGFDNFVVVIRDKDRDTLVYKHSISAILPKEKFSIF